MPNDVPALAVIAVVAAITFASRMAGAMLMSRIDVSPRVERFLDALSVSVIAALVASIVTQNGLREGSAVAFAAAIVLGTKSAIWAMTGGMAIAAAWTFLAIT
jgi:branched-subunit amino acid transport protein